MIMVSLTDTQQLSPVRRYGVAVLGIGVAVAVRWLLHPLLGSRLPFLFFFLAMIPIAWLLGRGPALLAIVLATCAAITFFMAPFNEFGITMVTDLIGIVLFVVVNLVIVWFTETNRIVRRRLEAEIQERLRAESTILEQVRQAEFGRDLGLALTSGATLAAVLDRCHTLTIRHLGGIRARILTVDESGQLLDLAHAPNMPGSTEAAREAPHGLLSRVAAERRPLVTNRLVDDSGLLDRSWIARDEIIALAGCPLVVEAKLVGVWALYSKTPLTAATLAAMDAVASSLALGIERKRTEENLQVGEARKTAILETSLDGIVTMDHIGRVVEFNPAAERIFGHAEAAVRGHELAEIMLPSRDRARHRQGLDHYLRTGEGPILNRRIEVTALRADGTEFPAEVTVARIPISGPPLFTAHIRDIADRKQAENALRSAKEDAEEANRAKDRFLAILSHELRTPLNPIALMVNSILRDVPEADDLRRDLELIRHYVGIEARLIDDLLDVMRITRGKMPLHWEHVNAHHLIEQAVTICAEAVQSKGLQLSLDLQASVSMIEADPNRLCQVFWNLIKNAVKFTPTGGTIVIRSRNAPMIDPADDAPSLGSASHIDVTAAKDMCGPDLIIEVTDSGIGIESDVLPQIFEAFYQGDPSIVRQDGGLGLGLAICSGVVEGHGGSLSAESAGKNRGATFTVRLHTLTPGSHPAEAAPANYAKLLASESPRPAATRFLRDDEPSEAVPNGTSSQSNSLQILVVEDEPATVRLMSRLLRSLGHRVTAAESIAEAGRLVAGTEPFDLVVSDIGLPDGTGLDLMRRIRATRGDMPAIALTGFGTEEDIELSRAAGFSAHMTNPIDFTRLAHLIESIVGNP